MNRRKAIQVTGLSILALALGKELESLMQQINKQSEASGRMPLLFVGHGSPMNAIADNEYTKNIIALGQRLPRPKAILVVSAHWLTQSTWVTQMQNPRTIHDFYGFPKELFEVQYPAPGSPDTARLLQETILEPAILADSNDWGLDHGTWSVLKFLFPKADVPVLQLSLHKTNDPNYHFQIGQQLVKLRDQGILIIASGNLVHNLSKISWDTDAKPFDWAIEFDQWFKAKLLNRDFHTVLNDFHSTRAGQLSIPSFDHYYPLHYILGAVTKNDQLSFEYEAFQNASISMRSFMFT